MIKLIIFSNKFIDGGLDAFLKRLVGYSYTVLKMFPSETSHI